MKNLRFRFSVFMFLVMPTLGVTFDSGGLADRLIDDLIEAGFENVVVILENSRAIVTYENRIYRDEIGAIKEVMALLAPQVEGIERITLIYDLFS